MIIYEALCLERWNTLYIFVLTISVTSDSFCQYNYDYTTPYLSTKVN